MKQIVKLIIKCSCVMLPLWVVCMYIRSHPLAFMDSEAPYYLWNKIKTNTANEQSYDVLILGDSVANAAYMPEALSGTTLNLALGGTTPVENYYTLQDWLAHNPAPKACYISFQDSHLQRADCFWVRSMYSHRYNLGQNLEMLKNAMNYKDASILTEHYILDFISYELFLPNKYIISFMNAGFNQRYQGNRSAQQADDLYGGRYIARGLNEYVPSGEIVNEKFYVNPLFDSYYRKILELCRENRIQVYIVKLPLPANTSFTEEYEEDFRRYYEELQKGYPYIGVDWFPAYPNQYFSDGAHMNTRGALSFSAELKDMYPEVFNNTDMTPNQSTAINEEIKAENKIEWIIKCIDERPYTVVICDNTEYPQGINNYLSQSGVWISNVLISQDNRKELNEFGDFYCVSGDGSCTADYTIFEEEGRLMFQLQGQDAELWDVAENTLELIVIDNNNRSIVCEKKFRYADAGFVISN